MNDDPVDAFLAAWQQGHQPDLFAFVEAHPGLSDGAVLQLARIDQQCRWRAGDPVPAEVYLQRLPRLAAREEDALVLICGEFGLAVETGGQPTVSAYQVRFPGWAERLALQLAFESALAGDETVPMPPPVAAGPPVPGRYEILGEIGAGAMGVVYRARHLGLDQPVAIKVLRGATVATPEQEMTVRLEGQLIARLNHPGIVKVLDFDTHQGQPYLVMELVEGGSLADAAQAGPLDVHRAVTLVEQLALAVHHAHQRGVIHRDIKPANVLLTAEGQPKLADFGLARIQSENQAGGLAGTPRYMAPEQARGEPATADSDVWALGAILYELLTGRPAFGGGTVREVLANVCSVEPVPVREARPAVPRDLGAICRKCLQKVAACRYGSAQELARDLAAWREGRPVSARRLGVVERAGRWLWRNPGTMAAVLGLAALIGLFALVLHDGIEQERVEGLVEAVCRAEPAELPACLARLEPYHDRARPLLLRRYTEPGEPLAVALALLPGDEDQVAAILARLPTVRPELMPAVRESLRPRADRVTADLWSLAADDRPLSVRLRAASLLAAYQPKDARWPGLAPALVEALLQENPLHLGRWQEELDPVGAVLVPELSRRLPDLGAGSPAELVATNLLTHWAADQPETLARLLTRVDGKPFALLLAALRSHAADGAAALERYLDAPDLADRPRARAAIGLHHLGRRERFAPLLAHGANPGLRSELIHRVAPLGVDPASLAPFLHEQNEPSIRRAVVLALGEFAPEAVTTAHPWLVPWLVERYENDPDPGLHAAVRWLLRRRWASHDLGARLERIDRTLAATPPADRRWWTSPRGELFVRVEGNTFAMGTPPGEQHREDSPVHQRTVPRAVLFAAVKVDNASFEAFQKAQPGLNFLKVREYSPDDAGPCLAVSWYQAAAYCNWRSAQEGLPESEWCYRKNKAGEYGPGMRPAPDALSRRGYRLPTEAEWELACRAGATTRFPHGASVDLLGRYAYYQANAGGHAWENGRLKPNDLGVFDLLGNAWEWCHETYRPYPEGRGGDADDGDEVRDDKPRILRGGSYVDRPALVHPGLRCPYPPDGKDCSVGFRIVRTWK